MNSFRHREDVVPVLCIVSLSLADLLVFFHGRGVWFLSAWLLVTIGPKACICSWNHHHQHLLTFHRPVFNRLLEVCYAFHTGITTNAWILHHVLGHHVNYLDQTKDESAWKRRDGTTMGELEYTLVIALTGYLRAFRVARRYPRHQPAFFGMGLVVAVLLAAAFAWNPLNAAFVFAIPMVAGYLITCWHTYCHHAGLDTTNPYEASHNIMHRSYNVLTGNLGYHTAHHVKPRLHWSKLPAFHATIADRIPPHLYIEPFFPMNLLPSGVRHRGGTCTPLLAAILLATAGAGTATAQHTQDSLDVVKQAVARQKAVLVDVREPDEWRRGHVVGARLVPLSTLERGMDADQLARTIPKDAVVYTYCMVGGRSAASARFLRARGYDVRPLKPGYPDLVRAGFPSAEGD